MAYDSGDVVLVPYPCRDRLGEKVRPGVVVSAAHYNQRGDIVVASITTHKPRFADDYELLDWASAGLKAPSTVRMLFATLDQVRVILHAGRLSSHDLLEVQKRVQQVFQ